MNGKKLTSTALGPRRLARLAISLLLIGSARLALAQAGNNPLNIFENYFVTGDYIVSGWVEGTPDGSGFAPGTISVPDTTQINALGGNVPPEVKTTVPKGADIVAAYLYWGTVEGSQSTFAGQQAYFNGYKIVGKVLGNPNAPTSWSAGGCSGSSQGSKTMRAYRADVRPYLPRDLDRTSTTFGAIDVTNGGKPIALRMADSGSQGNTVPIALGATLVVIFRVLSPPSPLNAIVLYDGSFAPSNNGSTMTQKVVGFYEPGVAPSSARALAKLTHIVANGQPNKSEQVFLNSISQPLPSLYGAAPPFPGIYSQFGSAWDNPTWVLNQYGNPHVLTSDTSESTIVVPSATNHGCVNWGAIILSTTVQDSDKDGLLDIWKNKNGYTDAVSGNPIALPKVQPGQKDLFVELDYLTLRDANNNILHSHLPKQAALDAVGRAFANQGISVHFDLPSGIYSGDPYVVSTGTGGNEISESSLVCTDPAPPGPLCAFRNQVATSWKGGFEALQNDPKLGNFQAGRAQSYHYSLFGHALGKPRSYWGALASNFAANDSQDFGVATLPQLVSIVVSSGTGIVTIKSPLLIALGVPPANALPLVLKPGDLPGICNVQPLPAACSDTNRDRVTVSGSLLPGPFSPGTIPTTFPLNGTYKFSNVSSSQPDANGMITTTFQIMTAGVPNGTYDFSNEPQLGISYLGPTSSSGHADFAGGGDLAVTLGLWGADDTPGCQPDPSVAAQVYCDDQVGTLNEQIGTFMHELGHTLTLTHGGTYYADVNSSVPTYEINCKPNFISIMNYLFQVRGFVNGGFDYSGQMLQPLNETTSLASLPIYDAAMDGNNFVAPLSESSGVGTDDSGQSAAHLTRWYSLTGSADSSLQDQALAHCDGTPIATGEPQSVRVDGTVAPGGTFSAPLDWNNDLSVADAVRAPGEDLNHNGIIGDPPFSGFNDWQILTGQQSVAFQQMNARGSGFGFSEGGGLNSGGGGLNSGGGGLNSGGGGTDNEGGGLNSGGGGLNSGGGGLNSGGGGLNSGGGGVEQDEETANSTVDAPTGLICTKSLTMTNGTVVPACTGTDPFFEKGKAVPLTWTSPSFGQIRSYTVWRAVGSFTAQQIDAGVCGSVPCINNFSQLATLTGSPPSRSFIDNNLHSATYTYFVTDSNKFGAKSGFSAPIVVTVK